MLDESIIRTRYVYGAKLATNGRRGIDCKTPVVPICTASAFHLSWRFRVQPTPWCLQQLSSVFGFFPASLAYIPIK